MDGDVRYVVLCYVVSPLRNGFPKSVLKYVGYTNRLFVNIVSACKVGTRCAWIEDGPPEYDYTGVA